MSALLHDGFERCVFLLLLLRMIHVCRTNDSTTLGGLRLGRHDAQSDGRRRHQVRVLRCADMHILRDDAFLHDGVLTVLFFI